MGDELVSNIMDALSAVLFANGLSDSPGVHAVVDTVVNRLRDSGMPDDDIAARLKEPDL